MHWYNIFYFKIKKSKISFDVLKSLKKYISLCEILLVGFVGEGMLTASVSGLVFAAPPSSHILYAIRCLSRSNKGKRR